MDRKHWLHLGLLVGIGALLRALLFNVVGVWGDFGFYLYNSQLILEGQQPFVDFLARSPLFMYPFAWLRGMVGHPIILLRSYVIAWWLLAAIPLYFIGREIGDHRTAIAGTALYLFAPYPLAYGMWANTQGPAVFFTVLAVYAVIRSNAATHHALAGALVGLAFLSRRSVVTVVAALTLAAIIEGYRTDTNWRRVGARVGALTAAFAATLFVGYLAVMRWDIGQALALYEIHAVNLFVTTGRGGYPLIGANPPMVRNSLDSGRIPIFNDVCQLCGRWTARTLAKTLIVSMPLTGLLLYYGRDIMDRSHDYVAWSYPVGVLAFLGLFAVISAIMSGYYIRAGIVIALALFAIVAWFVDELPSRLLWGRASLVLLLVVGGFFAGYLYRNRLVHVYYFLDLWPFATILAGTIAVEMWRRADRPLRTMFAAALVLSLVGAGAAPSPATETTVYANSELWYTIPEVQEYRDDLNRRTEPGATVLSAQPVFAAVSHTQMVNDNARLHYVYATFYPDGPAVPLYRQLNRSLRNGSIEYVIVDDMTQNMLGADNRTTDAFESNYCRAEGDALYQKSEAYLYRYQRNCSDPPSVEWLQNATA